MKMPTLRRYFLAGLLVWVPLGITLLVIKLLIELLDRTLLLLPPAYRPDALFGYAGPGLGIVFFVAIVLLTGMFVANFFGRKLVGLWEAILARIPLVRSIYSASKQVLEALFSAGGESFRKVLLIEYPRKGLYTLAFQTGNASREIQTKTANHLITVFVPTTPNPTSGFILMVPKDEVLELEMSVEDGLKLLVSLGVVAPKDAVAVPTPTSATLDGTSVAPPSNQA